jgi:small-conductance mechanosensitive channel
MTEFLRQTYWNNTVEAYLWVIGIILIGFIVLRIFRKIFLFRLKKFSEQTTTVIDDILVKLLEKSLLPLAYFGLFVLAIKTLNLPQEFHNGLNVATVIVITFLATKIVISALNFTLRSYAEKSQDTDKREKQLKGISALLNVVIWVIALIFLLDNLGVKVSAVVAGLGIGGIAVALAAQHILGDLFSYFVIFFDRPFEIGDFINVGDKVGTVEYIGIKTTRIKAIGGEQLVFSNTDLTNSRIHNFKKMERRRILFRLGVIYQTPAAKLKLIPLMIKDIISSTTDVTFDRGHLSTFGDFSINFEFVYFVDGSDYIKYMDIQQSINLRIYEQFEKEGIEFAYPTQTLFLNKEGN